MPAPEESFSPTPPPGMPGRRKLGSEAARRLMTAALDGPAAASSADWQPPSLDEINPHFSKYGITRLIGRGGMGVVYQGSDPVLGRAVAIKVLPLELSDTPGFSERFRREAWSLAQLDHPHIVHIHETGTTADGHLFFVMEYVEGTSLGELLASRRSEDGKPLALAPAQALEIVRQVCEALVFTHRRGILHRDIKPANILMDSAWRVKLADFGLARLSNEARPPQEPQLTGTGEVIGTRDYMAPELLTGSPVDERGDVYATGVLLYEMLTGRLPRGAFPPPSRCQPMDRRLDLIVHKALQPDPSQRFPSMPHLLAALQPVLRTGGKPRRRRAHAVVAGLAAATTAAWIYAAYAERGKPALPPGVATGPDLIFEESFDYPPGDDALERVERYLTEGPPGTSANVTAPGLDYTDAAGYRLVTRGLAATFDAPAETASISQVALIRLPERTDQALWISLLARQTAGTNEKFFNLALRAADNSIQPPDGDSSVDEVLAIGMRSAAGPQQWQIWDRSTSGNFSRSATSPLPTTKTAFLLARWEKNADDVCERATLWVNPPLHVPPPEDQGVSFTSNGSDIERWSQVQQIRLGAGRGGEGVASTAWIADEIRIGWTREAVTPHIR